MVNPARTQTKTFLDTYLVAANMTKDDDSTALEIIVCFGKPEYPLSRVFKEKGVDGIFSIAEPDSRALIDATTQAPRGYDESVPIDIMTIDKTGITGTEVKDKMEIELRRIVENNPAGSQRSLLRRGDQDKRLGSTVLYSTRFVMRYVRDTT